jgi:hypothetical protein
MSLISESYHHPFVDIYPDSYCLELTSGDFFVIYNLIYHVAVYVNPDKFGGYQDRYCYMSPKLAIRAIHEFASTGSLKYWQKHHNKNISIAGNNAYKSGDLEMPENKLYTVDWNIDDLHQEYPFQVKINFEN